MQDWTNCLQTVNGVDIPTIQCLEIVFSNILYVAVGLAVLALFVMFLVGGFKYLTSGGDPKATTAAQQTLTYAVLGLGLMAIAFLIFKIIESFTGVNVTTFSIPTGTP
ncbi:hypothetical protein A3D03_01065 [Candidatus Gottesmanbacteria bacterium RIFCSPHIGHO2_02_FULL_40_13]|uniref:DUF5671 domain-containing protein n=1 Tax=Candidatus Gottesmanbacteria bacterium RIFCSPHIGHO2_02_FULL_40_13 TaxID=1798384 RepID=A0A1F6A784_9BACT|nr:MAG: hypothetical protein A3D03_01065 [Candidatus Gottesmanbacteria bacterium RIFCSPHIGHO2_02_FULL_40_13]